MKTLFTALLMLIALNSYAQSADVNSDGVVDLKDLTIVYNNQTVMKGETALLCPNCFNVMKSEQQVMNVKKYWCIKPNCNYEYKEESPLNASDSTRINPLQPSSTLLFKLWALIQNGTSINEVTDPEVLTWYRLMEEHR